MNIVKPILKEEALDKGQVELVQKQQHEFKLVASQKKVKGHTLFSFNRTTGEIKPATINRKAQMNLLGEVECEEKVAIERDCFYEQALHQTTKTNGYLFPSTITE